MVDFDFVVVVAEIGKNALENNKEERRHKQNKNTSCLGNRLRTIIEDIISVLIIGHYFPLLFEEIPLHFA
jgi:hypothetical protein